MLAPPAIATHHLTKRFDRQIAVHDVDLVVAAGDVYGLIGPNGAGKTTLIRLLALAESPSLGEIFINGQPLRQDAENRYIKQLIGYLPDNFPLYDDLTVWDCLEYFARLYNLREPRRSQRLREVLELVQLTPKRRSKVGTLSRGMKQRLSLARTILHEPILLLLDEPVSGLDPIARLQFRDVIKALQEAGMTIVISSHVLSDLAELCTAIGVMELGYLVESAPLAVLYQRLSQPHIELATLGDVADLQAELRHWPQVNDLTLLPDRRVRVQFAGDPAETADLLRSLIAAGIPLTSFHTTHDNLESIFLKLGHQQVS